MGCTWKTPSVGINVTNLLRMPIQVVESEKLDEKENLWLKNLRRGLDADSFIQVLKESVTPEHTQRLNAYLGLLLTANPEIVEEAKKRMTTLEKFIVDIGLADKLEQKGKISVAKNLLATQMDVQQIIQVTGLPLEIVLELRGS